jgi:hypothetical protein
MPIVDVRPLEQEGLPPALIEAYRKAVDAAWADVAPEIRGLGSRPVMYLQLQDPTRDRETVTVSAGIGARFGATSAKTPAELKRALVQHLKDRFVPKPD